MRGFKVPVLGARCAKNRERAALKIEAIEASKVVISPNY
jgi:hypothetical protein